MSENTNLQDAANQLSGNSTVEEIVNEVTGEMTGADVSDIQTFHCAVNHSPEDSINCLVRVKELGNDSPSMKMLKSLFGSKEPQKGENFTAEIDMNSVFQSGDYLQGNAKVVERDGGGRKAFDMKSYMAALDSPVEPAFSDDDTNGDAFTTE